MVKEVWEKCGLRTVDSEDKQAPASGSSPDIAQDIAAIDRRFSEATEAERAMWKALHALYLSTDPSVGDDVNRKVRSAWDQRLGAEEKNLLFRQATHRFYEAYNKANGEVVRGRDPSEAVEAMCGEFTKLLGVGTLEVATLNYQEQMEAVEVMTEAGTAVSPDNPSLKLRMRRALFALLKLYDIRRKP